MAPEQVLITGASGWLGTALVHALRTSPSFSRSEIVAFAPAADAGRLAEMGIRPCFGDIADPAAVQRFAAEARPGDVLFHTAGLIHPRRTKEFTAVNAVGTANVVTAFSDRHLHRAVYVSSNSPFGTNPGPEHLFDEDSPYHPFQGYGRSKMRGEQVVRASAVQTHPWVIVRAPWFYGPHQPPRQTLFFRLIRSGGMPLFGDGRNRRSMAYIDNLAAGLLLTATIPEAIGEAFWIADRRPYPMAEILETVAEVLESDFKLPVARRPRRLPGAICEVAVAVDSCLQACGFYNQKIHVLSEMNKTIACSIVKAERVLGYNPQVELREGMRRSIEWCLRAGYDI